MPPFFRLEPWIIHFVSRRIRTVRRARVYRTRAEKNHHSSFFWSVLSTCPGSPSIRLGLNSCTAAQAEKLTVQNITSQLTLLTAGCSNTVAKSRKNALLAVFSFCAGSVAQESGALLKGIGDRSLSARYVDPIRTSNDAPMSHEKTQMDLLVVVRRFRVNVDMLAGIFCGLNSPGMNSRRCGINKTRRKYCVSNTYGTATELTSEIKSGTISKKDAGAQEEHCASDCSLESRTAM